MKKKQEQEMEQIITAMKEKTNLGLICIDAMAERENQCWNDQYWHDLSWQKMNAEVNMYRNIW